MPNPCPNNSKPCTRSCNVVCALAIETMGTEKEKDFSRRYGAHFTDRDMKVDAIEDPHKFWQDTHRLSMLAIEQRASEELSVMAEMHGKLIDNVVQKYLGIIDVCVAQAEELAVLRELETLCRMHFSPSAKDETNRIEEVFDIIDTHRKVVRDKNMA